MAAHPELMSFQTVPFIGSQVEKPRLDKLEWHRFPLRQFAEVSIASGQQMESVWRQLRLSDLHTRPGRLLSRRLDQAWSVESVGLLAFTL